MVAVPVSIRILCPHAHHVLPCPQALNEVQAGAYVPHVAHAALCYTTTLRDGE